jgi:hypothetical protein
VADSPWVAKPVRIAIGVLLAVIALLVIVGSELWITAAPASGGDLCLFGTHIQCYKLDPGEYVRRVTDFFDGAFGHQRA